MSPVDITQEDFLNSTLKFNEIITYLRRIVIESDEDNGEFPR